MRSGIRLAALPLILAAASLAAHAEPAWEPGERDAGQGYHYQVFSQAAPDEAFVRYQVRGTIHASPRQLRESVRVIAADPAHAPDGHTRRVVEAHSSDFVVHTSIEVPFLSDRDIVTRGVGSVDAASGIHRVEWRAIDDPRIPKTPDVVRIEKAAGFWEFAPNPEGNTRVTYETYLDLGGAIPRWIVNAMMPGMVADNFADLASEAQASARAVGAGPRGPDPGL